MSLSSYCRNCSNANNTPAEMASNHCNQCEEARKGLMTFAKEQNPELTEDQLLSVGRDALRQRAHHPRMTFLNPRDFRPHAR